MVGYWESGQFGCLVEASFHCRIYFIFYYFTFGSMSVPLDYGRPTPIA